MQFMVLVTANTDKGAPPRELVEAESEAVRALYMDGLVRQIWVSTDRSHAFMITEADTVETVTERIGTLPMAGAGFIQTPQIVPLGPYWGFAPRG